MKKAIIFPGQGSQKVGMGKDFYDAFPTAKHVFQEVDEALGQNLSHIIFEGPEEDLRLTHNTQPALMAVSLAIMAVLKDRHINVTAFQYAAGHSLGEYSTLAATEVLPLATTARLLRTRGIAMQQAVPSGKGGMAALLGVDLPLAQKINDAAAQNNTLVIANDNGADQIVLSGDLKAIERAVALAPEMGAKKAIQLPVSAPFHSPLMQPAAEVMKEALETVTFHPPLVPVFSNVTAQVEDNPEILKRLLVDQITHNVRWREIILTLQAQGVTEIIEIGSGKVLTNLNKRMVPEIKATSVSTLQDMEAFLSTQ